MDFGRAFSAFMDLWAQQRCSRVVANTSCSPGPESQGAVANSQFWALPQAAVIEIEQHLASALGALTKAIGNRQQFLAAVFVRYDDHQNTLFFLGHARFEVDPIRPNVEKAPVAEFAFLSSFVVFRPVGLQPGDGLGRQAPGIRAKKHLQSLAGIACGHALEVAPRQQILDRLCPT